VEDKGENEDLGRGTLIKIHLKDEAMVRAVCCVLCVLCVLCAGLCVLGWAGLGCVCWAGLGWAGLVCAELVAEEGGPGVGVEGGGEWE